MNIRKLFQASAVALLLAPPSAFGQDLFVGIDAAQNGDYETALRELRPLAEQGDAIAQHALGLMYEAGYGVIKDDFAAAHWITLSAKQGNAAAQTLLGLMYDMGRGVPKNHATAFRWYMAASEQGDASAQYLLGNLYYHGQGVLKNLVTSYMWLSISAVLGNEEARLFRDDVETKLTPDQFVNAQRRARTCMTSDYQDCD